MTVTKRLRVYRRVGLFRSYLTNAKSYNADHIGAAYWPRRGRIIDIGGHEGAACLQVYRAFYIDVDVGHEGAVCTMAEKGPF
jgi:hypothetical protein